MSALVEMEQLGIEPARCSARHEADVLAFQHPHLQSGDRSSEATHGLDRAMLRAETNDLRHLLALLRSSADKIESQDLLFILLAHLVSAQTAQRASSDLLGRFGSLGNLLAMPWNRLEGPCHSLPGSLEVIKAVHAVLVNVLREPLAERPVIRNMQTLRDYLKVSLGHSPIEICRILFLDGQNGLIKDELFSEGTIDQLPLYPREVVKRTLEMSAHSIIIVHNHPCGDGTPSEMDILMTRTIRAALKAVGADLLDHIIVGRNRTESLAELRLI